MRSAGLPPKMLAMLLLRRGPPLIAALVLLLVVGAGSAAASSCTVSGSEKVCVSVVKESCSPGPPYRCRTARNEVRSRDGKFVSSQYSARRRTCRGFGGTKCTLDDKTFCSTSTSDKRCRTDSATSCRSGDNGKATTCRRTVDNCRTSTRSSFFACSFTEVVERCTDTLCRTTRTICKSGSGQRKTCYARFSEGAGRAPPDSSSDAPAEDEPATDDGSVDTGEAGSEDTSNTEDTSGGPPPSQG